MRVCWLIALVGLAGCDLVLDLSRPGDDDTTLPPGCSPASIFTDSFDGTGLPRPWSVASLAAVATATEQGGFLAVHLFTGGMEVTADPFLDVREQTVTVRMQLVSGALAAGDQMRLTLLTEDHAHDLVFGAQVPPNGSSFDLVAGYEDRDATGKIIAFNEIGRIPYDAGIHSDLGIQNTNGVTTFLAGSAGGELQPIFDTSRAPLPWIGFMRPAFRFGSTNDMNFAVDDFNGGGDPVGEACPASALSESFGDANISTDWQLVEIDCDIAFDAGGVMRMTLGGGMLAHECRVQSSTVYDLRDHSVQIGIQSASLTGDRLASFGVSTLTHTAAFVLTQDKLRVIVDGSTQLTSADVDLTQQALWRLSATADDRLVFEVAPDGGTFSPLAATQPEALGPLDASIITIDLFGTGTGADQFSISGIDGG